MYKFFKPRISGEPQPLPQNSCEFFFFLVGFPLSLLYLKSISFKKYFETMQITHKLFLIYIYELTENYFIQLYYTSIIILILKVLQIWSSGPLKASYSIFFVSLCHSLNNFLLFSQTRYFWLILYFSFPTPEISHFSKKPWSL